MGAGIYRVNDQYTGLIIATVRDASRPVKLYVEVDDEIISFDCRVTPYEGYLAQYPYAIDGVPVIITVNPKFWNLDLAKVGDTYFLSDMGSKERVKNVWFIPDASNEETLRLFTRSSNNGWKDWPQVVTDYLGYVGYDYSGI